MVDFFGPYSREIWALLLALALFFPVRQLIWALSVRREEKRDLLLAYRIQAFISRPERGVLQIEHIDIGAAGFPSGVRIFKERHPSDGKP